MLKLKSFINVLMVVTILFWYHSIDPSTACALDYQNGNENVIVDQCPPRDSIQGSGGVSTISGDHNYNDNWFLKLQFDPSNPDEIEQNSSIIIKVIGGCSPYTWSVAESGFTLENEGQPIGPINTLSADGTACGAATITVTDCGDTEVVGYVRCAAGKWVYKGTGCMLPGITGTWDPGGAYIIEAVLGKYKQEDSYGHSGEWGLRLSNDTDVGPTCDDLIAWWKANYCSTYSQECLIWSPGAQPCATGGGYPGYLIIPCSDVSCRSNCGSTGEPYPSEWYMAAGRYRNVNNFYYEWECP